jgi:hypothetical protein
MDALFSISLLVLEEYTPSWPNQEDNDHPDIAPHDDLRRCVHPDPMAAQHKRSITNKIRINRVSSRPQNYVVLTAKLELSKY